MQKCILKGRLRWSMKANLRAADHHNTKTKNGYGEFPNKGI